MTFQRHPLEIGPLVLGVVFLGIVVVWDLSYLGYVSLDDAAWIVPMLLIGAGGLGVVLAATKERRTGERERSELARDSATGSPHDDDPTTTLDPTTLDPTTLEQNPEPTERHDG